MLRIVCWCNKLSVSLDAFKKPLERVSDGAFVTANELDFCYTNWVPLKIICKSEKLNKSEVRVKIQNSNVKN